MESEKGIHQPLSSWPREHLMLPGAVNTRIAQKAGRHAGVGHTSPSSAPRGSGRSLVALLRAIVLARARHMSSPPRDNPRGLVRARLRGFRRRRAEGALRDDQMDGTGAVVPVREVQ
jgi:hypothetical protein